MTELGEDGPGWLRVSSLFFFSFFVILGDSQRGGEIERQREREGEEEGRSRL